MLRGKSAFSGLALTNYDTLRDPETRDTLREEICVAARAAYPWLRPEVDPRTQATETTVAPLRDDLVMIDLSRALADLHSWKAQLESVLRDAKRARTPEGRIKVTPLAAEIYGYARHWHGMEVRSFAKSGRHSLA